MVSVGGLLATVALIFIFAPLVRLRNSRESDIDHDCMRSCEWPPKPKTCVYNWMVEWFYAAGDICMSGCPNSTVPNPNNVECRQDKDCILLNGVPRPVLVANRSLPGPSIQVCEGDVIVVHVTNNLTARENEGTAIHWHGIHQRGTPYMDGTSMITQCPILMDQTFTYNFSAYPAGTHWWHAHAGYQRIEGLFGSLVVRQASEADPNSNQYDYDLPEHIVIAYNWHNYTFFSMYVPLLFNNFGDLTSDALFMNGYAVKKERLNLSYSKHAIFNVVRGNRYRFRVINTAIGNCLLQLSVDHHILKLIATDGRPIEPFDTTAFVSLAAERFDFVLNADKEVANYWFRAVGLVNCVGLQILGIIHYEGAPDEIPTEDRDYLNDPSSTEKIVNECRDGTESAETSIGIAQLNSAGPDATPKKADVTFHIGVQSVSPGSFGPTFDHFSFKTPSSPLLYQWRDVNKDDFCENHSNCSKTYCKCVNRIKLNINEVVEFVFINEDHITTCHPIHIHGHSFHVVAQEFIPTKITFVEFIELDQKGMIPRKLNSAVVKDTVHMPHTGYLIIRLIADNPGWWFLHCHTEGHQIFGLSMVLQEGDDEDLPPAPDGFPRCGSWPSKSIFHQPVPSLYATADWSSTDLNSSRLRSSEVVLLVLLILVSAIALGLFLNVVVKHGSSGVECSSLLQNRQRNL